MPGPAPACQSENMPRTFRAPVAKLMQVTESIEDTVADAEVTADGPDDPEPVIDRGTLIGRYVVLSLLGRGGMGVVVAAYDPELDRKVALKLLRPRGRSTGSDRTRLQREAQALAKLDHPNVVGVHDVGIHDEQLFVAMEFVDGRTLGAWLAGVKPWREVVRVFAAAGLGLAAAHEAGLVHRDFKPENVMIGNDGRVRVMDFGLARPEAGDDERPAERTAATHTRTTNDRLTQTGTLLGTPAYMSLEQFEGGTIDARSDQFSFCVTLYEALYGQRPFAGRSIPQIAAAVERGQIEDPPRGSTVPSWLRRVVVRGLARAPEQRWPSMRALLNALNDDPAVRRRKWLAVAGVVGLIAATGTGVVLGVQQDARTCTGMDAKLQGIWDDERRAQTEAALLATGLGHADTTWERVEQRLDEYANSWVAARIDACEATHRGEQSGELLDLRMACLDERLDHLHAAVDVLARADATVVAQAVALVSALPRLERCADQAALTAELPPPDDPHAAEQVASLERTLVDAEALEDVGKYEQAQVLADAVVAASAKLDYEPLAAKALLRQGSLQERAGDFARAETTLVQAYSSALALGMVTEATAASITLMYLVGDKLARPTEGMRWAIDADALSRAIHSDESRATYLNNRGVLAAANGEYDDAWMYYDDARAMLERVLGPEHPSVGYALYNLGNIAVDQGELERGREYYGRALAILETALGPEHPDIASCLSNRAGISIALKQHESARADLERSLVVLEAAALDADHPEVATTLNGLGGLAAMQGDFAAARGYFERTLAIIERGFGPEHPHAATVHSNLGDVAAELRERDEARRQYERALTIREAALGREHPDVAASLEDLGLVALDERRDADALALFERALVILLATHGPEHAKVADTRFALARALWSSEPERARELAELARHTYASSDPVPAQLAELDAWLESR
jgi:Tfp pilus assembly protein PilF/predicted Ser/Thr protein kinase